MTTSERGSKRGGAKTNAISRLKSGYFWETFMDTLTKKAPSKMHKFPPPQKKAKHMCAKSQQ